MLGRYSVIPTAQISITNEKEAREFKGVSATVVCLFWRGNGGQGRTAREKEWIGIEAVV